MSGVFKEALNYYRDRKREERQKKRLLKKDMDVALLEQFVQKCNDNPDLRIDIHLKDGTVIRIKTYQKQETHDLINGNIYEVK